MHACGRACVRVCNWEGDTNNAIVLLVVNVKIRLFGITPPRPPHTHW